MAGKASHAAGAPRPAELLVPPHSIQAEQAVLGSILLDSTALPMVSGLNPSDFYRPDHGLISEAVAQLSTASQSIDVVTVSEQLNSRGKLADAGGLAYLSTLVRDTPTAANASAYAQIVRERAAMRGLLRFARALEADIHNGGQSAQELTSIAQEQLIGLQASVRYGRGLIASNTLVGELFEDLDRRGEGHRGMSIGLRDFDELTGGLDAGDLIVIAGRPAMGKTALITTIATNVARAHQVALFSAEMPTLQLMRRCLALSSGISPKQLRHADRLEEQHWETITKAAPKLGELLLHVDETPAPRLSHIRAECTMLKARAGLSLVLVDYLQLVRGEGSNRYEQLRDVAYGLKALAKDLAVPVIALAQLNRDVEKRGDDKRPTIADLRDSGAIEEAADLIQMLYREGYYHSGFSMPYVLEGNVVKHRNGELGQCMWHFAGDRSLVTQLDSGAALQYRRLLAEQRRGRGTGSNDL